MLMRSAFPPRRHRLLWRWTVSNRRPPACKAGALPLSYTPRRQSLMKVLWFFLSRKNFFLQKEAKTLINASQRLVGQGGFEPPTPRLSSVCSNQLSYWPKGPHRTSSMGAPIHPNRLTATPLPKPASARQSPFGSSRGRDMLMAPNLGPPDRTATGIRR